MNVFEENLSSTQPFEIDYVTVLNGVKKWKFIQYAKHSFYNKENDTFLYFDQVDNNYFIVFEHTYYRVSKTSYYR